MPVGLESAKLSAGARAVSRWSTATRPQLAGIRASFAFAHRFGILQAGTALNDLSISRGQERSMWVIFSVCMVSACGALSCRSVKSVCRLFTMPRGEAVKDNLIAKNPFLSQP